MEKIKQCTLVDSILAVITSNPSRFTLETAWQMDGLNAQFATDLRALFVKHGLIGNDTCDRIAFDRYPLYNLFEEYNGQHDLCISLADIRQFLQDRNLLQVLDPLDISAIHTKDGDDNVHLWNRLVTAYICLISGFDGATLENFFDRQDPESCKAFNAYIGHMCEALTSLYSGSVDTAVIYNLRSSDSKVPWFDPSNFALRQLVRHLNHITGDKSEYMIRTFPVQGRGDTVVESVMFNHGTRNLELIICWSDSTPSDIKCDIKRVYERTDNGWLKQRLHALYYEINEDRRNGH